MKPRVCSSSLRPCLAALALWTAACGTDTPPGEGSAGAGAVAGTATTGGSGGTALGGAGGSLAGSNAGGATSGNGGSTTGGGTAGGAAGQAGSAGAAGGCAGKTYKLCEDFEASDSGGPPAGWTQHVGYGTASAQDQTVSTERFHGGAKALKSLSAQKGISRIQKSLTTLGATADKHWGRIFYSVQSPAPAPDTYLHVTFVGLMGTSENRVVDTVQEPNKNVHQWLFNNPNDQGGTQSPYDWTYDAGWHCAEWYVDVATKSYRFFHDSEEVAALAFTGKQDSQMSSYQSLIVGATHYQDVALPTPFVVWFDDLAVDDSQVGCK
jgi:hypothetical protein